MGWHGSFVPNSDMALINGKSALDAWFTPAWLVGVPEKEPSPVSCVHFLLNLIVASILPI
jgi:hypothetical protein